MRVEKAHIGLWENAKPGHCVSFSYEMQIRDLKVEPKKFCLALDQLSRGLIQTKASFSSSPGASCIACDLNALCVSSGNSPPLHYCATKA